MVVGDVVVSVEHGELADVLTVGVMERMAKRSKGVRAPGRGHGVETEHDAAARARPRGCSSETRVVVP